VKHRLTSITQFKFRGVDGSDVAPEAWLQQWSEKYPKDYDQAEYEELIAKHRSFVAGDFIRIGKWKDNAKTAGKWKANVASVAYPIWMQSSQELPKCPAETEVEAFLNDWANRQYTDTYKNGRQVKTKKFGLSRATTLLHFISGGGGRFPIFDSWVRKAMAQLRGSPSRNTVRWYSESYRPLFLEVAKHCRTEDFRKVDMALFSYRRNQKGVRKRRSNVTVTGSPKTGTV
jgi:hypothetical protein